LGLTISTRLVQLMGGRLWVESQLSVGSRFHFTIQVGVAANDEANPELTPGGELNDLSILIVDDNFRSRTILQDLAAAHNMKSVTASSGQEALAKLRAALPENGVFKLVLLDDRMPGMDGLSTVQEMRSDERLASLPVLMLCSSARYEQPGRRRDLAVQTLSKPVFHSQFLAGVHSALGRGAGKQSPAPRYPKPSVGDGTAPLRILLAEDNPVNQRVALRLLEKLGHSVTIVGDGLEALRTSGTGAFDVVLMDVQMPGMDGLEATAAIREREQGTGVHIPILALTAHAMTGDRERCLAAGMDGYITKPIQTAEIAREIHRIRMSTAITPDGGSTPVSSVP
jgi:CheY-like chemotaxis protein